MTQVSMQILAWRDTCPLFQCFTLLYAVDIAKVTWSREGYIRCNIMRHFTDYYIEIILFQALLTTPTSTARNN
jgi:hypothetical protein